MRKVSSPGQPTAMPSAMVAIDASGTGRPAASEAGNAAAPRGLRADDPHVGPQRLDRGRDPGDQPAAAGAHDDRAHVGALLEELQADRALAGDDVRVVERVDQHAPVSSAKASAATSASSTVDAGEPHLGAVRRGSPRPWAAARPPA